MCIMFRRFSTLVKTQLAVIIILLSYCPLLYSVTDDGGGKKNVSTENKNELLYEISFDNGTFDIVDGNKNKVASPIANINTLVDGIKGKAVKIDDKGVLEYPLNFKLPKQGLIEFYFKPDYAPDDAKKGRMFFWLSTKDAKKRIFFVKNLTYSYMYTFGDNSLDVKQDKINVNSWNYVGMQWDETKKTMQLNINGFTKTLENVELDLSQPMDTLVIGNSKYDDLGTNSAIDEVKIWKVKD